ncbi:uncharacterized protein LOC103316353 [Nasonia vitripennis]|uniref:Uncharacterized protein n=1 Tax=Nasonia vitripennis TaxID=7425 RepID=A0A7M7QBD1_NASVI|nr:uncharacterized protein LOC103316353 [Nasonia vitripennis]XP_032455649.1 uncharacterized protein LOC103316353 [Nasonia vitripennis]
MSIRMGPCKELLQVIKMYKDESNLLQPDIMEMFTLDVDGNTLIPLNKETDKQENLENHGNGKRTLDETIQLSTIDNNTECSSVGIKRRKLASIPCSSTFLESAADKENHEKNNSEEKTTKSSSGSQKFTSAKPHEFMRTPTLQKVLLNHEQGKNLVKKSFFTPSERRLFVRVLVAELIATQGNYPRTEGMIALAQRIIEEFPFLKDDTQELGYEHFCDPRTRYGFIPFRVAEVQKKLKAEDKKYVLKKKSKVLTTETSSNIAMLSPEELAEKISYMEHKYPSPEHKESITATLKETFFNRRNWILGESPTIAEVLQKYPRLQDYNGDMIIAEFELIFPEKCDDFLSKFGPYYVPRIFEYTRICNYDLWKKHKAITDDVLKALLLLITLLPVSNAVKNKSKKKVDKPMDSSQKKKVKMIEPYRFMIENINAGANVQEFVKSKRSECTSTIQPYIIQVDDETPHFYVIADNAILTCNNRNDFTAPFDLMFKIYFIFNIQYPVSLQNVYTFIESYVYRLTEKKSISIVASLYVNLKNMNLTHDSNSSDSDE